MFRKYITAITAALLPLLVACTEKIPADRIALLCQEIYNVSGSNTRSDSLRLAVSMNLSAQERRALLDAVADSSDVVRATALFITVPADSAAAILTENPSRHVFDSLLALYNGNADSISASVLPREIERRFRLMPADRAADFLVVMCSPTENGRALEPGDEELEHELRLRYKNSSAEDFDRAVDANTTYLMSKQSEKD